MRDACRKNRKTALRTENICGTERFFDQKIKNCFEKVKWIAA